MIKIIELICWAIAGILVLLLPEKPNKLEYFLVWVCLIIRIVVSIVRG